MIDSLAPIAFFVYNRPDHTATTLKYLRENELAVDTELFIFSDAAKTSAQEEQVKQVRAIIAAVDGFKKVTVIMRDKNMGLAASIIEGVGRLVETYGKVIVFEDDLISSPITLQYFNDALHRYATNNKVMHIGAYMYPLKNEALPETFFYRAATSWGWATWDRAWQYFNPDIDALMAAFSPEMCNQFAIEGTMNFWKQMEEFKAGKNNSWAIRWYASVFLNGGLTLNPAKSLINNIGHDGSGVHSGINSIYEVAVNTKKISYFPAEVMESPEAYAAIRSFLKNRKGSLIERGIRFLNQKLKG